jgi:23S rRNA (cytosine1962-C5)-methyltransferase
VDGYELLDFGGGARLERVGGRLVVRPHPAAEGERADPSLWGRPDLEFVPGIGWGGPAPVEPWELALEGLVLEARPTPTGQLGLFPEQAGSWHALRDAVGGGARRILNLFAYTGVGTLVAAAAGAEVAHVDGSRPTVAWARRNAELSGLTDRPIRWLVDDATRFVARDLRRGRRYDGVVLDPPSYGHGPGGRQWRLEDDLPELLAACTELVDAPRGFVHLTAHTPGFGPAVLAAMLAESVGIPATGLQAGWLALDSRSGRRLELGAFVRWPGRA